MNIAFDTVAAIDLSNYPTFDHLDLQRKEINKEFELMQ